MNIRLKTKIFEQGLSQLQVARDAGLNDSYLSKIIQGWIEPSTETQANLAKALHCTVDEIFHPEKKSKGPKGVERGNGKRD